MFIPVFLVSVGPDPQPGGDVPGPRRWSSPALFIARVPGRQGARGGALGAAARASRGRRRCLLFCLSAAQAAATLAATVVGFQLGLFDSSVVNAVLVRDLRQRAGLDASSARARAPRGCTPHEHGPEPLGTRVVVGVGDPALARGALSIARAHRPRRRRRGAAGAGRARIGADRLPRRRAARLSRGRRRGGGGRAAPRRSSTARCCTERSAPGRRRRPRSCSSPSRARRDPAWWTATAPRQRRGLVHAPPVAVVRGSADRLGIVRMLLEGDGDGGEEGAAGAATPRR